MFHLFSISIQSFVCYVKMPRKAKSNQSSQAVEPPPVEPVNEPKPIPLTKDDYLKARATIKQFREEKRNRPKRQCSEKQLAALAQGRAKNNRFKKQDKPSD